MTLFRWQIVLWVAVVCFAPSSEVQAQKEPHIGYIYPAGGRRGTAFEVTLGGQHLDGVTDIFFSGKGVEATVVKHVKPFTKKQLSEKRMKLRELQKKVREEKGQSGKKMSPSMVDSTDWLVEAEQELAELRKLFNPKKQPNSQISEIVTVQIKLAPDAEPGEREVRLRGKFGLSNPLGFHVGLLPEYREQEPNDKVADGKVPEDLPILLNGQILPGDVDRFRFRAQKGARLVAVVSARELIPYLADAVPGWFQAVFTLYDVHGNEVAYVDDYRFHPDPVLLYEIPTEGEYVLEIRDSIYRGREDFIYRIALGELPFVTSIFPLGAQAGTKSTVQVEGWNLSKKRLEMKTRDPGVHTLFLPHGKWISNPVLFAADTLPEYMEKEGNNDPKHAQRVSLPLIMNGRIDRSGDWDVFRFQGKKGEEIVGEVQARRLNSPLDSALRLTDAWGRELAVNDDWVDRGAGLVTHHADSYLSHTLLEDGTYYLFIGDTQHKGGTGYSYRLRISFRRPDFELRAVPASINIRVGGTAPFRVYALRKDAFQGEIDLKLINPPSGFTLSGGRIPAGQDTLQLTLTAPPGLLERPVILRLQGRAVIQGQEVYRNAVPAEDMMQAFLNRHLVRAKALMASVTAQRPSTTRIKFLNDPPVILSLGETTRIQILAPGRLPLKQVRLKLSNPPEGVTLVKVQPNQRRINIVLQADSEKAQPGLKGNLIVDAFLERPQKDTDGKPKGRTRRIPLGVLPAIPFEIVQQ